MNNPIDNFPSAKTEIDVSRKYFDKIEGSSYIPLFMWYHLALVFLNLFAELVAVYEESNGYKIS